MKARDSKIETRRPTELQTNIIVTPQEVKCLLKGVPRALVLVHPRLRTVGVDKELWTLFDGYEVCNSGSHWPEERIAKMKELMPKAWQFRGIDAHSDRYLTDPRLNICNETDFVPKTDLDLIKWVGE